MRFVLALALYLLPFAAPAQTLPGQDAPAFRAAVSAWLDGDDLPALQALGDEARAGNTAAQILLARISEEWHLHRHVTDPLPRAERIALLKQPQGISGTSWLAAAQETSPLAAALVLRKQAFTSVTLPDGSKQAPEAMAAVAILLENGEQALATEVAFKLFDAVFLAEVLTLLDSYEDRLDPSVVDLRVRALLLLAEGSDTPAALRAEASALRDAQPDADRLALAQVFPTQVLNDPEAQNQLLLTAEAVTAWTPMRQLCEVSCPNSYETCLVAGAVSLGYGRRAPFASPLQSLIPDEAYWQSPRMRGDAARRMAEIPDAFNAATTLDQCFADTVSALAR
jgi:PIN domain nuclease of toxin-antitoxin system